MGNPQSGSADVRFGWIWGGPWYSPLRAVCGRVVFGDVWSDTYSTTRLAGLVATLDLLGPSTNIIWLVISTPLDHIRQIGSTIPQSMAKKHNLKTTPPTGHD